jgi:hypothetical protein
MAWYGEDFDVDLGCSGAGRFVDLAAQIRELTTRCGFSGEAQRAIEIPLAKPFGKRFSTFAFHVLPYVTLHGFDDALIDLAGDLEREKFLHVPTSIAGAGAGNSSFLRQEESGVAKRETIIPQRERRFNRLTT